MNCSASPDSHLDFFHVASSSPYNASQQSGTYYHIQPKKVLQVYKKMTAAAQLQFKTTMHALIVNSLTDYENALKFLLH